MKNEKQLRSQKWFGGDDKMGFVHRSWMRNQGYPDDLFRGRPVIGICNTWSELTPCNGHLREFAEIVKKGVLEAGGFPLEFPVMSLGETIICENRAFIKPSAASQKLMKHRGRAVIFETIGYPWLRENLH